MPDLNNLQEAILKTLIYSDIFSYPLKVEEIYSFLISHSPCSQEEIVSSLSDLRRLGLIEEGEGLIFLKGQGKTWALRKERNKYSEQKLIKAKKLAWLFKLIPWVQLVAVTGAVAAGNAEEESDIDLMTIADSRRLWLTRFLLLGILRILGLRVDLEKGKTKDRFCLNLFISDDRLEFPQKSLYTASEIVRIKLVFERDSFYRKFLVANKWTSEYLPNFSSTFARSLLANSQGETLKREARTNFGVLDSLEKMVRDWQIKKIRQNFSQADSLSDDELLLFHPNDCRRKILEEFNTRSKGLGDTRII